MGSGWLVVVETKEGSLEDEKFVSSFRAKLLITCRLFGPIAWLRAMEKEPVPNPGRGEPIPIELAGVRIP